METMSPSTMEVGSSRGREKEEREKKRGQRVKADRSEGGLVRQVSKSVRACLMCAMYYECCRLYFF